MESPATHASAQNDSRYDDDDGDSRGETPLAPPSDESELEDVIFQYLMMACEHDRLIEEVLEIASLDGAGGLMGTLFLIRVLFDDETEGTFCYKRIDDIDKSIHYGLPREALFYKEWRTLLPPDQKEKKNDGKSVKSDLFESHIPQIFYADGNMETGTKNIVMEAFADSALVGHFYGPGSPLNWGKDLDALTLGKGFDQSLGIEEVTELSFDLAARLHALWWRQDHLTSISWLRGAEWYRGEGREDWEKRQARFTSMWEDCKATKNDAIHFDPLLFNIMEACVRRVQPQFQGWDHFQEEIKGLPFCLVHGDFHPGNLLIQPDNRIVAIDWEMVGLGSGPQEIGQFMISHVDPIVRAEIETGLVKSYYDRLTSINPKIKDEMTFFSCWNEYVMGGLGKFLYMLPLLGKFCPPPMYEYFHDQILAFVKTHNIRPDDVPMPRV